MTSTPLPLLFPCIQLALGHNPAWGIDWVLLLFRTMWTQKRVGSRDSVSGYQIYLTPIIMPRGGLHIQVGVEHTKVAPHSYLLHTHASVLSLNGSASLDIEHLHRSGRFDMFYALPSGRAADSHPKRSAYRSNSPVLDNDLVYTSQAHIFHQGLPGRQL
jgi:hypothetical protein